MAPSIVYLGSGQFWSEIRRKRTCQTSQKHIGRELQSDYGMGRQKVHRNHIGLGLQATSSSPVNARVHQKGSQTIPAQTAQASAATIFNSPNKIWRKEKICNTRVQSPTFGC